MLIYSKVKYTSSYITLHEHMLKFDQDFHHINLIAVMNVLMRHLYLTGPAEFCHLLGKTVKGTDLTNADQSRTSQFTLSHTNHWAI